MKSFYWYAAALALCFSCSEDAMEPQFEQVDG